jgi:hypothetical protein
MIFETINSRRYARFERLAAAPGLTHAFSTRGQDVSMRRDARAEIRAAARDRMAADLGLAAARLCPCDQVHGPGLELIDQPRPAQILPDTDAVITNVRAQPIMGFSADCPLILIHDPRTPALGIAHASWRCTVAGITRRLIHAMRDRFGCTPAQLVAGIGPSAGPTQYEVKQDVYDAAADLPDRDLLFPRSGDRMFFNLWQANRWQMLAEGIPDEHIETAGICTMTDQDTFYSYRREGRGCGHFALLAALT